MMGWRLMRGFGWTAILACCVSTAAHAQAVPARSASDVVRIWPGPAPGTADWSGPEVARDIPLPDGRTGFIITNVTVPTLTVVRPAPGKANGTAVIVCPGGGFQSLAWKLEGTPVAAWLAQRGITAFILKYRVRPTPVLAIRERNTAHPSTLAETRQALGPYRDIAVADGLQAMRHVRDHAAAYGIRPDHIGMIGFSAGAMTTMGTVLHADAHSRPDFAASIYGGRDDTEPTKDAPPIFVAAAEDDPLVPVEASLDLYRGWSAAGRPVEMHLYDSGGHGFALRRQGLASDRWALAFEQWLAGRGLIAAAR